jgi:AraC-like DNA-binding protein
MDKKIIFVYYFVIANFGGWLNMELYYNPNVQILVIQRCVVEPWRGQAPVSLWQRQWRNDNDYHNVPVSYWRLYWNSAPGAAIRLRGQAIALTPERIILVPPGTVIDRRLTRNRVNHFYIHFSTDLPAERLPAKIYVFKAEECLVERIKLVPAAKAESKEGLVENPGLALAMRGLIHYLLSRIPADELRPLRISARLALNMAFVESHIRQAVSNSEIARHMGASVSTMLRQYQRELGLTPQAYLRQKRIEGACALLRDLDRNIKQVADETGFCDRYHFSRAFKDLLGITPLQYRSKLN